LKHSLYNKGESSTAVTRVCGDRRTVYTTAVV